MRRLDSGFTATGRALERVIGLIKEAADQKRYGPDQSLCLDG
jgi:hypothetical protein